MTLNLIETLETSIYNSADEESDDEESKDDDASESNI